jgi:uncharacterized membrane protein
MRAKINLFGHAVHPFLVVFPLGLLLMVPVFDIVHLATGHIEWSHFAYWLLSCGLIGALVAAVVGLADFLQIPRNTEAWRTGLLHLGINLGAVTLFGLSWLIRAIDGWQRTGAGPFMLALGGFFVMLAGGWFGNELVQRHGMSISENAGLDTPRTRPVETRQRHEIPVRREPEPTL